MLTIGPFQFDVPFVQAALSGYSDLAMRRQARRHGCPYTINEVVLDKMVIEKGKKQRRILCVAEDDHPVGGQLMGDDPEQFGPAAAAMAQSGYDIIDINFGCPVKKVLGRCRGGFHLSQPRIALDIIRRVYDAIGKTHPVTVKMRRGMDDSPESECNFFEILDGAYEIGVSAVTVHGRTVRQRYIGPSHWPFLAKVKQHIGHRTMLGSGDLFSAKDCLRMMEETGVDGVTIARGCIGHPWIFQDCIALYQGKPLPAPPSILMQREAIAQHFIDAVEVHGKALACRIMRKFGIKYAEHHPLACDVRDAFVKVKSPQDFQAVLDRWYAPTVDWPATVRKDGHGDLVAAGATSSV